MDWIKPDDKLPAQGKKILYFDKGDIYVVQRFGQYWLPIPFYDSQYAFCEPPELWADIYCPDGYSGKIHVIADEKMYDIDALEKHHPDVYEEFIEKTINLWFSSCVQENE